MVCTATILSLLIFGNSTCLAGYPSAPTVGQLLAARCPGLAVIDDCRAGRGVFNPGIGSTATPLAQLQASLATYQPSACLLMLPVNDWVVAGATPESAVDGLVDLVRACEDAGATAVLATGFPASDVFTQNQGRSSWMGEMRQRTLALGAALGLDVIDTVDAFDEHTWPACTWNGSYNDGIHPNTQACRQMWADYVARRLP